MFERLYGALLFVIGFIGFICLLAEPLEQTTVEDIIAIKIVGLALFGLAMLEGRDYVPHEED